jgi:pimeloyl-ACP methyl ester carboxylesterase
MIHTFNKQEIFYTKSGNGKVPAIILHGWGQTHATMLSIEKALQEQYVVYNIDLPGFGLSPVPNNWTINDYTNMIEDFVFENRLDDITIIGHSFGGRIGIKYASRNTNIKHLCLIGSAGIKHSQKVSTKLKIFTYKNFKKITELPLINKNKNEYQYNLKQIFGSNDYNNANPELRQIMINAVSEDLTPDLSKINTKASLFWGIDDVDAPFKDGQKMNKLIRDSKMYTYEAGHYPFLEQPEAFFSDFEVAMKVEE